MRTYLAAVLLVGVFPIHWLPAVQEHQNPKLVCETPVFDFGVTTNIEINHSFVLKNEGLAPLVIKQIRTGCSCTISKLRDKLIEPGAISTVDVTISLRNRSGLQRFTIYVHSNDPDKPILQLRCVCQIPLRQMKTIPEIKKL